MKYLLFILSIFFLNQACSQIDTSIYNVSTAYNQNFNLKGMLWTIEWTSSFFNENRKITIYEPPSFNKDSIYPIVITTDNQAEAVASGIEELILNKTIKPVIIVGIHNREPQPVDTILHGRKIDFRCKEMIGNVWLTVDMDAQKDTNIVALVDNRVAKYSNWIAVEVSNFLTNHYNCMDKSEWTLGGFSNGGAIVMNISTVFPENFGYVISMSPGEGNYSLDYSTTKSKFFLCAGINEPGFYKNSLEFASALAENNITYKHKSYLAGHEYNMWYSYYLECLSQIYRK